MSKTDKVKTKNIGEVSEFYSFVYVLANRFIPLVDGDLRPFNTQLEFLKAYRKESTVTVNGQKYDELNEYDLSSYNNRVVVRVPNNLSTKTISSQLLKDRCEALRELLLNSNSHISEDNSILTQLQELLQTSNLTAKASDKSDFSGEVRSANVPVTHKLGFTVKSQVGSNSTLINASGKNSAFQYRVVHSDGSKLTPQQVKDLQQWPEKHKALITRLIAEGYKLEFVKNLGDKLKYNLRLIDSVAPEIISVLLYERFYMRNASVKLKEIVEWVCTDERASHYSCIMDLGDSFEDRVSSLMYKVKNILLAFTTGATVGSKWDGIDRANGGFLIVKKDCEVVCLELFTRNSIGQYLLNNTSFDNPSSTRHSYGELYVESDCEDLLIDLQLQVRFR